MHVYVLKSGGTTMTCRTAAEAARLLRKAGGSVGPVEVLIHGEGRTFSRSLTPMELRRLARELKAQRPVHHGETE